MFNILDFIDSKDIREHNKSTNFTPIEQAVLIYNSTQTTVDEKLSAWKELLNHYDEEAFKYNCFGERQFADDKSNKQVIADTVTIYENALAMQHCTEDVIFEAVFFESDYPNSLQPRYFKDYPSAFAYLQECKKEYIEDDLADVMTEAKIRVKQFNTESYEDTVFCYDHDLRMVELIPGTSTLVSDSYDIDNIFIHIPLPFKKGDILRSIRPGNIDYGILSYTPNQDYRPHIIKFGDSTDMWFRLDTFDPDSSVEFNYSHASPLDYEFCPFSELPEELSILFALRYVYLDEIHFSDFLTFYSCYGKDLYPKVFERKYPKEETEQ